MDQHNRAPRLRLQRCLPALARPTLLGMVCLLGAACTKEEPAAPPASPDAAADPNKVALLTALSGRTAAFRGYRVEGTVAQKGSAETLAFSHAMTQPMYLRATVGAQRRFVFDGTTLAAIDDGQKAVVRRALASMPEEEQLLQLHAVFGDFVCEGWKPPLLRNQAMAVVRETVEGRDRWRVTVPIDDATLKEASYVFAAPHADFVERTTIDRGGNVVARTVVTQSVADAATGLSFPRAWERTDGTGTYVVTLAKTEVNPPMSPADFDATAPAGYAVTGAP